MSMIDKVFVELVEFMDQSNDAQIIVQIEDISEFIKKSFDQLEKIARSSLGVKKDLVISKELRPYILDTNKSMQLVNQFEMVVPSKESYNAFDLKFLRDKSNPFTPKRGGTPSRGEEMMRRSGSSQKSF